jgi:hypothetical protein
MIPEVKLVQVVTDLHQRVAQYQLKREKQEQLEALAKQEIQKSTVSDGLWHRFTAWLSTSHVRPNEKVSRVITERSYDGFREPGTEAAVRIPAPRRG